MEEVLTASVSASLSQGQDGKQLLFETEASMNTKAML